MPKVRRGKSRTFRVKSNGQDCAIVDRKGTVLTRTIALGYAVELATELNSLGYANKADAVADCWWEKCEGSRL